MKTALMRIIVLVLCMTLAACGSNHAEKNHSTSNQKEQASQGIPSNADKQPEHKPGPSYSKNRKKLADVTLDRVVDGDTIKVIYNGKKDTVRYLLVDTPETKKPNSCVQPYGKDASKRNKELVSSGELQLEFDKGDRRDKYGRLLAYVYVDGKSVQETLLKEGLARVAYVYEPNTKYIDQFRLDEQEAKSEKLSIWSRNGYVTNRGFNGCVK
ncbi:thermonuclease family protein [Bacillus tequilensis]|uniref:Thermonuclease family protein n=1 Tax=Bacillus tequilensis TaxID=227866 RepID=A0A6H0WL98_9BACI|nr:thermonuclease family protein [Bacillus tequilensis]QIW80126.1 thermonuclease family protein [Bacillus tequilensis]